MDVDLNLPSVKRVVAFRLLKRQPAEIQKMIVETLSFREQVHFAAESAIKHKDWTTLLLVNDLNVERLYTKFTNSDQSSHQSLAISDVIFLQPEFQDEQMISDLDGRTMEELKELATHSRDFNMCDDRPSNATKQVLGLSQRNRETWASLLARVQNDEILSFEYSKLRREEDMVRYLASSRPQCLLEVLIDLVAARGDFTVAPYSTLCTCCLLDKFTTPTAQYIHMSGAGKICEDCLGPELERRFIRRFPLDASLDVTQQQF
jgi:hypothetical protein